MFSIKDDTRQSNGVVTLRVGGIHLPNVLIDSGATSNQRGNGLRLREFSGKPEKMPRSYLHMGTLNHYQPLKYLLPLSCVLTLMLLKLTLWL